MTGFSYSPSYACARVVPNTEIASLSVIRHSRADGVLFSTTSRRADRFNPSAHKVAKLKEKPGRFLVPWPRQEGDRGLHPQPIEGSSPEQLSRAEFFSPKIMALTSELGK
jgi:hypothetical protein